jgi:hypothetical protein
MILGLRGQMPSSAWLSAPTLSIRSGEKCRLYSGSRRCHHDPTVVVTEQVAELNSLSLTVKQRTEYLPEMMRNITAPGYAPTVP